ncbi:MAG: serine protein kinase RIO [Thaumarchaeota archaeon]|nr:serine protein kinase RIO [Nitrososphaerota archaeon]
MIDEGEPIVLDEGEPIVLDEGEPIVLDEDIPKKVMMKVTHNLTKIEKEQRILRRHESDREVFEEVFDKSTLMILYHIMNTGIFSILNGVVASGKESRVYWGVTDKNKNVAVKIYLITCVEFKNRLQYIVDDPRFNSVKKGMRNIVKLWARKEFKNLRTAYNAEIPVPKPIYVKDNVLVTQFIGEDGVHAPTLNVCEVSQKYYTEILEIISKLYKAKLVHADLSEYNIFLHNNKIMLFDFGSAVHIAHPNAEQFLIRDISNINRFFNKKGFDVYELKRAMEIVKKD